jgi:hypothetical protein
MHTIFFNRLLPALLLGSLVGFSTMAVGTNSANAADAQFTTQAMTALLQGVADARTERHSPNSSVRAYAKNILSRDLAMGDKLAAIASYYGIKYSTKAPAARFATTAGSSYLQAQLASQQRLISLFHNEMLNGGGADFRTYAADQLPVLHKNLTMAQQLASTGNVASPALGAAAGSQP